MPLLLHILGKSQTRNVSDLTSQFWHNVRNKTCSRNLPRGGGCMTLSGASLILEYLLQRPVGPIYIEIQRHLLIRLRIDGVKPIVMMPVSTLQGL